jgi:hypothetical protein
MNYYSYRFLTVLFMCGHFVICDSGMKLFIRGIEVKMEMQGTLHLITSCVKLEKD